MHNLVFENEEESSPQFYIFSIRIDAITYYWFASTLAITIFLGTLKSFQRFIAIYAPLFYNFHVTNKLIIKIMVSVIIIFLIAWLPVVIIMKDISKKIQACIFNKRKKSHRWTNTGRGRLLRIDMLSTFFGLRPPHIKFIPIPCIRFHPWNRPRFLFVGFFQDSTALLLT